MFESIIKFFKKVGNKEEKTPNSKEAAKERLHLVLMQDRANVSADFLELMKQEIIEVIKKYIEVDESAIDVRLTNKENEDGTNGAPALYANIPIINIKNETRKLEKNKQEENEKEVKDEIKKEENENNKKGKVEEENEKEVETNKEKEQVQNEENKELKENEEQEEKVEKIEEEKEDLTQKVQIKEDSQENNEKDNEKSTINNNYNKNNKKKNKKSNKK